MRQLLSSLACFAFMSVSTPAAATLKVFACEPEWAALAQELGGDELTAYSATTAHQLILKVERGSNQN